MAVRFERILPGPVERIWDYLTDSAKRGQWLATGPMELKPGGKVELVWRNDELTPAQETRPAQFTQAEHRISGRITRCEPPRLLAFTWGEAPDSSDVTFELTPKGDEVLLVVTHRRLPNRTQMVNVSAGWHAHLAVLDARARGRTPPGFWSTWQRLAQEYEARLPQA
jgi:uncharacterized protein YndB with AHSA1/START domain